MSNAWLQKAVKSIREQAEDTYQICEDIATEQHLEADWVFMVFQSEFKKVLKEKGGAE